MSFGRMHRFWCWHAWLFISGTLFQCALQFSNVDRRKGQGHPLSRWDRSQRKPELEPPACGQLPQPRCSRKAARRAIATAIFMYGGLTHRFGTKTKYMVSISREPTAILCLITYYCRASRRNKNAPSTINRTLGNQTSSSGCTPGLPRNVSPMMTKRK